ncbi:hypothetical protein LTR66_001878 [Elasticomyces elasticus]|nr:hypothetical protein LTR66_001878 [Elasticomyces elasticus]
MFPAPTAKLPQRFALEDKTIVITGGARGLGLSFATALAEAGANIAAIDLDDSPPSEFGKLQALGVEAKYYAANVQDYDGLRNTIERIPEEFGSIDGCIPAAGIMRDKPFLEHTAKDINDVMGVNVVGVMYTVQHCAAQMVKQKTGGNIVCISSSAGHHGCAPMTCAAYVASKHAVLGLVKQVAGELAQHGIRCNSISPGTMRTDMLKQIFEGTPGREQLLNSGSMLKRVGEPDELHGAMLYLMSDASSYMTGNDIFVNGGKL